MAGSVRRAGPAIRILYDNSILALCGIYRDKPYFDPEYVRAGMLVAGLPIFARYAESYCVRRMVDGL